jgi:hypothetical protein
VISDQRDFDREKELLRKKIRQFYEGGKRNAQGIRIPFSVP